MLVIRSQNTAEPVEAEEAGSSAPRQSGQLRSVCATEAGATSPNLTYRLSPDRIYMQSHGREGEDGWANREYPVVGSVGNQNEPRRNVERFHPADPRTAFDRRGFLHVCHQKPHIRASSMKSKWWIKRFAPRDTKTWSVFYIKMLHT